MMRKCDRGRYCDTPSDRGFASAIKGIEQDAIQCAFEEKVIGQLDTFKRLDRFPKKELDIAIDMHLIPRYDRVPDEELTRSKYKNGTTYFERYIAVKCVNGSMCIVLAASYLKRLESVFDYVDVVLKTMAEIDIEIHLVLLDREFFSVDAINTLQKKQRKISDAVQEHKQRGGNPARVCTGEEREDLRKRN